MQKVLQGRSVQVSTTFFNDETPIAAGDVTATVTTAAGVALVTDAVAATPETGVYTYTIDKSYLQSLNKLAISWESTTQGTQIETLEVVGGFHVPLRDIRQAGSLEDMSRFTTQQLKDARNWWEELSERWCGYAFVPRYNRFSKYLTYGNFYFPHPYVRSIRSANYIGTVVSPTIYSSWEIAANGYVASFPYSTGLFIAEYEHGLDEPDEEFKQAAILAIRDKLIALRSGPPSRQTSIISEGAVTRIAQPGPDHATGIPEVDRVLNDRKFRSVMVA